MAAGCCFESSISLREATQQLWTHGNFCFAIISECFSVCWFLPILQPAAAAAVLELVIKIQVTGVEIIKLCNLLHVHKIDPEMDLPSRSSKMETIRFKDS